MNDEPWPGTAIDALFTANTLHIMSWQEVDVLFTRLADYLALHAPVCIYGPFNYNGNYTSACNADFDRWLKNRNPLAAFGTLKPLAVGWIWLRMPLCLPITVCWSLQSAVEYF